MRDWTIIRNDHTNTIHQIQPTINHQPKYTLWPITQLNQTRPKTTKLNQTDQTLPSTTTLSQRPHHQGIIYPSRSSPRGSRVRTLSPSPLIPTTIPALVVVSPISVPAFWVGAALPAPVVPVAGVGAGAGGRAASFAVFIIPMIFAVSGPMSLLVAVAPVVVVSSIPVVSVRSFVAVLPPPSLLPACLNFYLPLW